MRHVPNGGRGARLAVRHALVPIARLDSPEAVTQASEVELRVLEEVPVHARRELHSASRRLTEWLGGVRLFTVLGKRS